MKISNRNYPILEKIRNKDLSEFYIFPEDKSFFDEKKERFVTKWNKHADAFNSQLVYVTEPFWKAVATNHEKLRGLFNDIIETHVFKISGSYIVPGNSVISVDIDIDFKNEKSLFAFYMYSKHSFMSMCYVNEEVANDKMNTFLWVSNFYKNDAVIKNKDYELFVFNFIQSICILEIFRKFADVETKYLPPNKVTKDIICKYVNDTKTGITMLDSKWFTTLVKSDGFTVHGHFRLQPCGKEMKDRKLIWINEFMKTGYTAPARKLAEA